MVVVANSGNAGCPCIDTTAILASLPDRQCTLPDGETTGIQLTIGGTCVPFSYGSSACRQHDLLYDPACNTGRLLRPDELNLLPPYCVQAFCYVDATTCKSESEERVIRSGYFPLESNADVFYSYSTCNSTEDAWLSVEDEIVGSHALGGIEIIANVPNYRVPVMYKRDDSGQILSSYGKEYYRDNVPFEGVYLDYFHKIWTHASKGDVKNVTLTHRSRASDRIHPSSSFTAAVQDIHDGLVDMAVGPFWITGQRLKMTGFTIPIAQDRTYLVIPKPKKSDSLYDQVRKVLQPFSVELWLLILGIIACASLLSVWFQDNAKPASQGNRRSSLTRNDSRERRRPSAYARLCLDSCLQKGTFFCSAGVQQDDGASLPSKLLLFGFGFFILIAVSAYVANLAAFLTLSSTTDTVKKMDEAVAKRYTICALPALRTELELTWPDAKFYYETEGNGFLGVLDDYRAGKCQAMAIGYEDTSMDVIFLERMCDMGLVYTDSVIVETPIAFPIRPGLAAGFSYWMHEGGRQGFTLQASKDLFAEDAKCTVHFSAEEYEGSEYDEITVKNMFFPAVFFASCAALAVILQIVHLRGSQRGRQTLVGRTSTLRLNVPYERSYGSLIADMMTSIRPSRSRRHKKDDGDNGDANSDDEESPPESSPISMVQTAMSLPGGFEDDISEPSNEERADRSLHVSFAVQGNFKE